MNSISHISFVNSNLRSNQAAPTGAVVFSQNPQDKVVLDAGTYTVEGLKGGDTPEVEKARLSEPLLAENGNYVFAPSDSRFHAANSFSAVARTIKFFEEGTGIPVSWSFKKPQLEVVADAGEMLNAYYQKANGNVNFFHSTDPVTKQVVYSGDSGEVVSHETGHAILDALRPAYLLNWRADCGGFHESFGDMLALLMSVQDDKALAKVVDQTGGDMTKINIASNLGEELGVTINHTVGRDVTGGDFTRSAINKFTWKEPKTLPNNPADPNELGSEVHNFSRLWTGAFYDVFTGLVNENRSSGMEPAQAIREASNEGLRMLGRLVKASPKFDFTYKDMAQAFVKSDRDNGGKHVDLITKVYKEREILPADFKVADLPPTDRAMVEEGPQVITKERVKLEGNFGNFTGAEVEIVRDPSQLSLRNDSSQVHADIQQHIENGRILYTNPHQHVTEKDLVDASGTPYMGVLRWRDGQPVIERNTIVT